MRNMSLYHHGIKGQKWGVRRYQNKDGSLTTEGRYRIENAESAQKEKDLTDEQKKKLKTAAIVTGGIAVAAIGAYFVNDYMKKHGTITIKSGKTFQHMSRYVDEELNKPFYMSFLKSDNKIYEKNDLVGSHWNVKMKFDIGENVKIPSDRTVVKAYNEFAKKAVTDPTFKASSIPHNYTSFNRNLSSPDINFIKIRDAFYSDLRSKGYSAIRDVNDQMSSGVKMPLVYFGNFGSITVTSREAAINAKDLTKSVKNSIYR